MLSVGYYSHFVPLKRRWIQKMAWCLVVYLRVLAVGRYSGRKVWSERATLYQWQKDDHGGRLSRDGKAELFHELK